jgi:hypothetical protein
MKMKTVQTIKVGKATLVEKEIFVGGEYADTVCIVKVSGVKFTYTSIAEALAHKGEWYE